MTRFIVKYEKHTLYGKDFVYDEVSWYIRAHDGENWSQTSTSSMIVKEGNNDNEIAPGFEFVITIAIICITVTIRRKK